MDMNIEYLAGTIMVGTVQHFYFAGITFVTHFIIDYITSRLGSKLWSQGKEYESLVVLGFDQFLHTTQLILTYQILFI